MFTGGRRVSDFSVFKYEAECVNISSSSGQLIPWVTVTRYLGTHIVSSRSFKCSLSAANAIFRKIEG